jgi:hypothetical protein
MDSRVREVNRLVRGYDKELFAKREPNGSVHVYRRTPDPRNPYYLVFALTDNWQVLGRPRDWGLEVIHNRLMAIDLWKDETVVDRVQHQAEKRKESDYRDFSNSVESFLYDFRRQFARATNDINTGTLDKKKDSRARRGA